MFTVVNLDVSQVADCGIVAGFGGDGADFRLPAIIQ